MAQKGMLLITNVEFDGHGDNDNDVQVIFHFAYNSTSADDNWYDSVFLPPNTAASPLRTAIRNKVIEGCNARSLAFNSLVDSFLVLGDFGIL